MFETIVTLYSTRPSIKLSSSTSHGNCVLFANDGDAWNV